MINKKYTVKPIKDLDWDKDCIVLANQGRAKLAMQGNIGKVQCFDLEVDHPDHLFILSNGIIVSNSSKHTAGMFKGKKTISGLPYYTVS